MGTFLAVMFIVAHMLREIVQKHTGINTLTGVSNSSKPLVKVYGRKIINMRLFSVLASAASLLYFYLVVDVTRIPLRDGRFMYMPKYEGVWMMDFFVAMVFAIYVSNLVFDLSSEVNYKYKYE